MEDMLSEVLWLLALLALSIAIVAFTIHRNPGAYRRQLERRKGRGGKGERRDGPVPDPFQEREDARNALVAALVALGVAVLLGYLALVLR